MHKTTKFREKLSSEGGGQTLQNSMGFYSTKSFNLDFALVSLDFLVDEVKLFFFSFHPFFLQSRNEIGARKLFFPFLQFRLFYC